MNSIKKCKIRCTYLLVALIVIPLFSLARGKTSFVKEEIGVNFLDISYQEALNKAKSENKLIFIDCYTSWCGPCKLMMNTVFKDEKVATFMNDQFINLKLNMEEEGDGQMIYSNYKIISFPTYLILDSKGTIINRFEGSSDSIAFMEKIKKTIESHPKTT